MHTAVTLLGSKTSPFWPTLIGIVVDIACVAILAMKRREIEEGIAETKMVLVGRLLKLLFS